MSKEFKHVIVISFDSLSSFDFELLKNLPNFSKLLKKSFFCPYVKTVYPSLTYPAHVSISTGKLPNEHGVINNTRRQYNSNDPDWFWLSSYIKDETIFDLATQSGKSVAALLWPVTGRAKIKYNMPEVFPNRWWRSQIVLSLINGSIAFQFMMNLKYGKHRDGKKQPGLDDFTHHVFLDTIKEKKPELTMVHFTDLDTHRHLYGNFSTEANKALIRHDERLGDVLRLLDAEEMLENTALVVLGDHASVDASHVIKLNVLLKEKGFLKINEKGDLVSFRYIVKSCDGSAYIYKSEEQEDKNAAIKNKSAERENDTDTDTDTDRKNLISLLEEFREKNPCIKEIIPKEKSAELGFDSECEYILEAANGYYFMDGFLGEVIESVEGKNGYGIHYMKSTHGYSPEKPGYGTVFIVSTDLDEVMYPTVKKIEAPQTLKDFIKDKNVEETDSIKIKVDDDSDENCDEIYKDDIDDSDDYGDDYDDGVELSNKKLTDEFYVIKELLGLK